MTLEYLEEENYGTEVFHDMVNKVLELVYYKMDSNIPHEWYFIEVFMKEIEKNNKLADQFAMYVVQFYPRYSWVNFDMNDYLGTVILECAMRRHHFLMNCDLGKEADVIIDMERAMIFGEIVTDFLIRFCGYSLIKCSGQNIIITARTDCEKRFEEMLYDGYSLQRKERVIYKDISSFPVNPDDYPGVKGRFYRRAVIPTKIEHQFDEIIEVGDGKYEKVFNKKLYL